MTYSTEVTPPQKEWLKKAGEDVQAEYERIRQLARQPAGIQHSGHEAESVWKSLLEAWLPPNYGVGVRKYLIFDKPIDGKVHSRETDLVVYHPAYPEALRNRPQVIISGVVAAFSVKLTLDRPAIREAIEDAAILRRGIEVDEARKIGNVLSPLIFGVLAHSHRNLGAPPDETIDDLLQQAARDALAPRENLDLLCIADSNSWRRLVSVTVPFPPEHPMHNPRHGLRQPTCDEAFSSMGMGQRRNYPVACLIGSLWSLLAQRDDALRRVADGLWEPIDTGGSVVSRPLADVVARGSALFRELASRTGPTLL